MVDIPNNDVTMQDLFDWFNMQNELKKLKAAEMLLRQKIFKGKFPNPKEGTNSINLDDGYVLKGKHTLNRDLDQGAFGANKDRFIEAGIHPDAMVKYKPELVLSEYRTLTAEQALLFDECLIIKPGSPALEIVLPAKAKKAEK